jgi:periplasmic copper chaperone A
MNRTLMRRASAYAGVLVAALALAPSAFAHAELFPNEIPSGDGYLLSLAVPNEKENASTTQIQVTMPADFDLEHVAPVPGWTASVAGQHVVNGEMGGGSSITLKGKLDGTQLAVLPFSGVPKKAEEYAFTVRQTYSDGSVVVWSGAETSDTPAARITATAAASSSGGGSDSSKTIAIIALVVGGLGLLVGGAGLVAGRRSE